MTQEFPIDPLVVTTLSAAPYAVLLVADDGRIVFDNPKADVLFGCGVGELAGRSIEDLMPERFRTFHAAERDEFVRTRTRRPMGKMHGLAARRLDGTEIATEISLSRLPLGDRAVTMAVVVQLDAQHVTPPDEASLRSWTDSTGELYHRLVQTAPVGIYRSSPEGLLLYANPALAQMLGYDDASALFGMSLPRDVYADPADRQRVLHTIEEGAGSVGIHVTLRRRDGTRITVRITSHAVRDETGAVVCYEGAVDDITDRLKVEEELHRMRGMESATRLASGVSHTLNNVLTSVLGNVQLALEEMPVGAGPARADLDEAVRNLLRAIEMLAKLRSFSSVDAVRSERLDLREFLRSWAEHLVAGPRVNVQVTVPEEPVHVEIDVHGLVLVLESLASNAMDAMPEGGDLRVVLAVVRGKGGNWAEVDFIDTGTGMSDVTLERAMEPYFSTKERQLTSSGAGLGLSLVYGIIRQHGGDVALSSKQGQGTTVHLRLPMREA